MLTTLFIAYLCFYSLFMIALFVSSASPSPPEDERHEQWWETPVDIAMAAVALVGMILLYIRYDPPTLTHTWKVISVALVLGHVYLNLKGRASVVRSADVADQPLIRLADVGTLALVGPSLILNLAYAFGSMA